MIREMWATYSVLDHLKPRALAADIMMFDRLVFPVPEVPEFPPEGPLPHEPGPVSWKRNSTEWKRWQDKHWDPVKQKEVLDILKPVIRKVAWDEENSLHQHYRATVATQATLTGGLSSEGLATRTALTKDLPSYVDGVAALGPAYRTRKEMEIDLKLKPVRSRSAIPAQALLAVLGWEFFSPDPRKGRPAVENLTDNDFLKETVAFVSGDSDFRESRTSFIEWQYKFTKGGFTDSESINRAVEEMKDLLADMTEQTKKLTLRKVARYAFRFGPAALGLLAASAGVPHPMEVAAGGAFFSLGGIGVDEMLFPQSEGDAPAAVAFVSTARRHFGWK